MATVPEALQAVLSKARFWETHAGQSFNDRQRTIVNRLLDGFEGLHTLVFNKILHVQKRENFGRKTTGVFLGT